jgi:hypothetical protein
MNFLMLRLPVAWFLPLGGRIAFPRDLFGLHRHP